MHSFIQQAFVEDLLEVKYWTGHGWYTCEHYRPTAVSGGVGKRGKLLANMNQGEKARVGKGQAGKISGWGLGECPGLWLILAVFPRIINSSRPS